MVGFNMHTWYDIYSAAWFERSFKMSTMCFNVYDTLQFNFLYKIFLNLELLILKVQLGAFQVMQLP